MELVACPGADEMVCIGCGACVITCPHQAIELITSKREKKISIYVNEEKFKVPELISVKEALVELGYQIKDHFAESGLFAPCQIGGCYSCVMMIDGKAKPICITRVREGMKINTTLPREYTPLRIVTNFTGHPTGGVGTPWEFKTGQDIIEVGCYAAGCNFRCPTCQNWFVTYLGREEPKTPYEAAKILSEVRKDYGVDRMFISGGECTLNKPWLVQFIRELKKLNPDPAAHFHVDTNGSLLDFAYLDELMEAGMTDIGIDLKALQTETFMHITGLQGKTKAEKFKETAWKAVNYLVNTYEGKVFVGVGIPYNKELITLEEITMMGRQLLKISPFLQVSVLNYRGEFRKNIAIPTTKEMKEVFQVLKDTGLKNVTVQTKNGIIGPRGK
jgi:pyruvate formate lyase activating enzyme